MQFLEMCATSDHAAFREAGMSLIESVPNVFGSDSLKYIGGIKVANKFIFLVFYTISFQTMFQSSLLYGANSSVRTAAVCYIS